jgi:hypothetical protein
VIQKLLESFVLAGAAWVLDEERRHKFVRGRLVWLPPRLQFSRSYMTSTDCALELLAAHAALPAKFLH